MSQRLKFFCWTVSVVCGTTAGADFKIQISPSLLNDRIVWFEFELNLEASQSFHQVSHLIEVLKITHGLSIVICTYLLVLVCWWTGKLISFCRPYLDDIRERSRTFLKLLTDSAFTGGRMPCRCGTAGHCSAYRGSWSLEGHILSTWKSASVGPTSSRWPLGCQLMLTGRIWCGRGGSGPGERAWWSLSPVSGEYI